MISSGTFFVFSLIIVLIEFYIIVINEKKLIIGTKFFLFVFILNFIQGFIFVDIYKGGNFIHKLKLEGGDDTQVVALFFTLITAYLLSKMIK